MEWKEGREKVPLSSLSLPNVGSSLSCSWFLLLLPMEEATPSNRLTSKSGTVSLVPPKNGRLTLLKMLA